MRVFVDTGIFIALVFKTESLHEGIVNRYEDYKKMRVQFITSDYILDELFTRCVYRGGSHGAKVAIGLISKAILYNELTLLQVETNIFQKAQEVFLKFSEHKISFTDATTYILCKDFNLDEVFTLDRDFKKIGVKTSF